MVFNAVALTTLALAAIHFQPQVKPQENWVLESLQNGQAKIIAHRGGALEGREGSRSALEQARDINVWGVQIAVQSSKDGVLTIFNDQQVGRVLQVQQEEQQQWSISDFNFEEIPAFRETIKNELGEEYSQPNPEQERPISLEQALQIFKHSKTVLIIEDKFQGSTKQQWTQQMKMFQEVKESGLWNRVVFQTEFSSQQLEEIFSQQTLTVKKDQETQYAFQQFMDGSWYENQEQNQIQGDVFKAPYAFKTLEEAPDQFQNAVIYQSGFLQQEDVNVSQLLEWEREHETEIQLMNASLKQAGKPTFYWTANQEQDFQKAIEIGASAIITDRPAQAQVYMMSQQWVTQRIQPAQWQQWR